MTGFAIIALAAAVVAGADHAPTRAVPVPVAPPTHPIEYLLAQLRSPDSITRALAARELAGVVAPQEDVRNALAVLRDDPVQKVREAATWALFHVESDEARAYDEAPRPKRISRPMYPRVAYEKHVEGTVELEILISETGAVVHVDIRKSIPELDQAAVDTVRKWTFTPARRNGKPVAAAGTAPVTFQIE